LDVLEDFFRKIDGAGDDEQEVIPANDKTVIKTNIEP
jgi:hypothetical protein